MQTEQKLEKIDLELLPEEARKELLDFYEYLKKKYKLKKSHKTLRRIRKRNFC